MYDLRLVLDPFLHTLLSVDTNGTSVTHTSTSTNKYWLQRQSSTHITPTFTSIYHIFTSTDYTQRHIYWVHPALHPLITSSVTSTDYIQRYIHRLHPTLLPLITPSITSTDYTQRYTHWPEIGITQFMTNESILNWIAASCPIIYSYLIKYDQNGTLASLIITYGYDISW